MKRILVLPGIANPDHPDYRPFYDAITIEGRKRSEACVQASYPGQKGESSGRLSFESATGAARDSYNIINPDWVIGISFGALVALGLAREGLLANALGLVLLGPTTRGGMQRVAPDEQAKEKAFVKYRTSYDTWLDDRFFKSLPTADDLIGGVCLPLRLIRGEADEYNSTAELAGLCEIHRAADDGAYIEILEIEGSEHAVRPESLSAVLRAKYFDGLFGRIDLKQ